VEDRLAAVHTKVLGLSTYTAENQLERLMPRVIWPLRYLRFARGAHLVHLEALTSALIGSRFS
jgi:hypothetical protein